MVNLRMESRSRKSARSALGARAAGKPIARLPEPFRAPPVPGEAFAVDEVETAAKLRRTVTSLTAEKQELQQQLAEARARIATLEKLVDEDPLMPVCNRRAFVRELSRMMALAGRYGLPGSVVYFDVNNLKQINDAHGHAAGDAALVQVAHTLAESVRATDVVGRLGGDELGVLLLRTDKVLAEAKAGELAMRVTQRPLLWQGESIPLSVAFGVYAFLGGEKAHEVLDAADRDMYRQKAQRRSAR